MKIFDCVKFFHEEELLHLRFLEYANVVDYFVIVEANKTHTGKPKEFLFPKIKDRFSDYLKKVIYVQVEDLPDYNSDHIWIPENFQRNAIMRGLSNANIGDKIIVSDCDEFWDIDSMFKNISSQEWLCFEQHLYYYWVNCRQNTMWNGTVMANYGTFKEIQDLRNFARFTIPKLIQPGGWHYSFMGGSQRIHDKVKNIAESKLIIDAVGSIEQIEKRINNTEDLWGRTEDYAQKKIVNIDYCPNSLTKFLELYPNFIKY